MDKSKNLNSSGKNYKASKVPFRGFRGIGKRQYQLIMSRLNYENITDFNFNGIINMV